MLMVARSSHDLAIWRRAISIALREHRSALSRLASICLSNSFLQFVQLALHSDTVDFEVCVFFQCSLIELFPALRHGFLKKVDFHLQTKILLLDLVNDLD